MRDTQPGLAEGQHADQRDQSVDATLDHERKEGVGEVLAAVGTLVDILLLDSEEREGDEDARRGNKQLQLPGELDLAQRVSAASATQLHRRSLLYDRGLCDLATLLQAQGWPCGRVGSAEMWTTVPGSGRRTPHL